MKWPRCNGRFRSHGDVIETRYLYAFSQSGAVYQPVYLGLRTDINPSECRVWDQGQAHQPKARETVRLGHSRTLG